MPLAAGRSAAVLRLPARRAVSLDVNALERVALCQRRSTSDLLHLGPLLCLSARGGSRLGTGRSSRSPPAVCRLAAQRHPALGRDPGNRLPRSIQGVSRDELAPLAL